MADESVGLFCRHHFVAGEGLRSRRDEVLTAQHLLGANNRDLSFKNVARSTTCCRDCTFLFLPESNKGSVELGAVAVRALHLAGENTCAMPEETGGDLFVEGSPVQRGGYENPLRQKDLLVRQLLTNTSESFPAHLAKIHAIVDRGHTEYSRFFYVFKQPVLLNAFEELGDDDISSIQQSAVLDEKKAAAAGDEHAIKKRSVFGRTAPS